VNILSVRSSDLKVDVFTLSEYSGSCSPCTYFNQLPHIVRIFSSFVEEHSCFTFYFMFSFVDSEDEEFFDCSAEEPKGDMKEERRGSKHQHKHSLWNQPVGRLSKHGNLRLLSTGEHLYIPVTQVQRLLLVLIMTV
jgi:hypothetical protein